MERKDPPGPYAHWVSGLGEGRAHQGAPAEGLCFTPADSQGESTQTWQ